MYQPLHRFWLQNCWRSAATSLGAISTYTAYSDFSGSGRYDCSGAEVNDPDLHRRIKVCEPVGDYFGGGTLRVTKRSNAAGMTIVDAIIKD